MRKRMRFAILGLVFLFTVLPVGAATTKSSSAPPLSSGPILPMSKTGGENVQFGAGVESFYYALMQPSELYVGNAINLIFSASHYQDASLTIRTTGMGLLRQSIVVRQFHDLAPNLPDKFTYEQRVLTETASTYQFDLSQTHTGEASDASLYFVFTGGAAKLEMELTSGGKTLLQKTFDFQVDSREGTAELILKSNPTATALQKDGIVVFGIGLDDTKGSGSIQASMDELAKNDWNWSSEIKTTGGITLGEQGNLPVLKDSVIAFSRKQWFIRSIAVSDTENKTGTIEITWGNPNPTVSAYATADGAIAVSYLRIYHQWTYDLVNRPPGSGAIGLAPLATAEDNQSSPDTGATTGLAAAEDPQENGRTTAPIMKIGLISIGGVAASGGFFFLFLFLFNAVRYMVRISGVVLAAGALSGGAVRTGSEEKLKIEQVRLIKELHTAVRTNQTTRIDLTGIFDFTTYSCVKISWNPKAFRGKRNITIAYVFDGKTLHEDVFRNAKEAVSERIIEMVDP